MQVVHDAVSAKVGPLFRASGDDPEEAPIDQRPEAFRQKKQSHEKTIVPLLPVAGKISVLAGELRGRPSSRGDAPPVMRLQWPKDEVPKELNLKSTVSATRIGASGVKHWQLSLLGRGRLCGSRKAILMDMDTHSRAASRLDNSPRIHSNTLTRRSSGNLGGLLAGTDVALLSYALEKRRAAFFAGKEDE